MLFLNFIFYKQKKKNYNTFLYCLKQKFEYSKQMNKIKKKTVQDKKVFFFQKHFFFF